VKKLPSFAATPKHPPLTNVFFGKPQIPGVIPFSGDKKVIENRYLRRLLLLVNSVTNTPLFYTVTGRLLVDSKL